MYVRSGCPDIGSLSTLNGMLQKKEELRDQMSDTEMSGETRTCRSMLSRGPWIHKECREGKTGRRGSSRHEDAEGLAKGK